MPPTISKEYEPPHNPCVRCRERRKWGFNAKGFFHKHDDFGKYFIDHCGPCSIDYVDDLITGGTLVPGDVYSMGSDFEHSRDCQNQSDEWNGHLYNIPDWCRCPKLAMIVATVKNGLAQEWKHPCFQKLLALLAPSDNLKKHKAKKGIKTLLAGSKCRRQATVAGLRDLAEKLGLTVPTKDSVSEALGYLWEKFDDEDAEKKAAAEAEVIHLARSYRIAKAKADKAAAEAEAALAALNKAKRTIEDL